MIEFTDLFFWRLVRDDNTYEYRIAHSVDDLHIRFGARYMRQFDSIFKIGPFTSSHYNAFIHFLKSLS